MSTYRFPFFTFKATLRQSKIGWEGRERRGMHGTVAMRRDASLRPTDPSLPRIVII